MKIQTSAEIKILAINGSSQKIPAGQSIDLEFSAIDTGGGFKDPILDFSFTIPKNVVDYNADDGQNSEITLTLSDPDQEGNEASFSYEGRLQVEEDQFEINGRLKEDQLSREVIDFVFKLLR